MKRLLSPALFCVPVLALAQAAPVSEAPKLTDEQTASIMKQLDQIEATITKNRGEAFSTALARFRSAMTGDKEAIDLYLACYKLENYDRKDLKTADFQDWRDRNEGRFKDPDFAMGLRLELEYLVLSIQAQDIKDIKDMGPLIAALQSFVGKEIAAVQASTKHSASGAVEEKNRPNNGPRGGGGGPRGGGGGGGNNQIMGTLRQSVKNNIFSQAYKLDDFLSKQEWEYSPGNLQGIFKTVLLPYYLDQKPAELPVQYDAFISAELAVRRATMSESEFAIYQKENQPELQWAKASYLLENKITPVLAMADMLKIIRENPNHPRAGNWVKHLRQAVNQTQIPLVPTSLETQTATPPAQ